MKHFIQIFIIGLLALSVVGCHGCKEPMADPCEGVTAVTADFKMEYSIGDNEDYAWFPADTILLNRYVRFTAVGEWDSVKWKVGLDPRVFTQEQFGLSFGVLGNVDVRMIGYRQPDNMCYPADDGIDTLIKKFEVVHASESRVFGHYEGYFASEPDSIFLLDITYSSTDFWDIREFPKGCLRGPGQYGLDAGYRHFFSPYNQPWAITCPKPRGWGEVAKDTIKFNFHYYVSGGDKIEDTYIGIKK